MTATDAPSLDFTAERIRRIRIELEETQEDFGNRIGVDTKQVSMYERGKNQPKAPRVIKRLLEAEKAAGLA